MKVSRKPALLVGGTAALVIAGAFFAAAAGSGQAKPAQAAVKVALVTDIGGLNDKGFNTLANIGLMKAEGTARQQARDPGLHHEHGRRLSAESPAASRRPISRARRTVV